MPSQHTWHVQSKVVLTPGLNASEMREANELQSAWVQGEGGVCSRAGTM
jgi:hypothetical protein